MEAVCLHVSAFSCAHLALFSGGAAPRGAEPPALRGLPARGTELRDADWSQALRNISAVSPFILSPSWKILSDL